MTSAHVVGSAELEFEFASEAVALARQSWLGGAFTERLFASIGDVFDELAPNDSSGRDVRTLRIERLEIDLGVISPSALDGEFTVRLCERLRAALSEHVAAAQAGLAPERLAEPRATELELLVGLLRHGRIDWRHSSMTSRQFDELCDRVVRESGPALARVLRTDTARPALIARLVRQFPERALRRLPLELARSGVASVEARGDASGGASGAVFDSDDDAFGGVSEDAPGAASAGEAFDAASASDDVTAFVERLRNLVDGSALSPGERSALWTTSWSRIVDEALDGWRGARTVTDEIDAYLAAVDDVASLSASPRSEAPARRRVVRSRPASSPDEPPDDRASVPSSTTGADRTTGEARAVADADTGAGADVLRRRFGDALARGDMRSLRRLRPAILHAPPAPFAVLLRDALRDERTGRALARDCDDDDLLMFVALLRPEAHSSIESLLRPHSPVEPAKKGRQGYDFITNERFRAVTLAWLAAARDGAFDAHACLRDLLEGVAAREGVAYASVLDSLHERLSGQRFTLPTHATTLSLLEKLRRAVPPSAGPPPVSMRSGVSRPHERFASGAPVGDSRPEAMRGRIGHPERSTRGVEDGGDDGRSAGRLNGARRSTPRDGLDEGGRVGATPDAETDDVSGADVEVDRRDSAEAISVALESVMRGRTPTDGLPTRADVERLSADAPRALQALFERLGRDGYSPAGAARLPADTLRVLVEHVVGDGIRVREAFAADLGKSIASFATRAEDRPGYYAHVLGDLLRGDPIDLEATVTRPTGAATASPPSHAEAEVGGRPARRTDAAGEESVIDEVSSRTARAAANGRTGRVKETGSEGARPEATKWGNTATESTRPNPVTNPPTSTVAGTATNASVATATRRATMMSRRADANVDSTESAIARTDPLEPASSGSPPLDASTSPPTGPSGAMWNLDDECHGDAASDDDLFITNAGLVLAAPFLQRLFESAGSMAQGAFRDSEEAERAVHLLEYLASGEVDAPEYRLPLNRVLCGVPADVPLARRGVVDEVGRSSVEMLLHTMTHHWPGLENTSPDALRETFLRREGRLRLVEDTWQLLVEERPYDVLLDRVPWGFRSIRHAWMPRVVQVSWR